MSVHLCDRHITRKEQLGYLEWHDKAAQSARKGEKQVRCTQCSLYFFPWEMKSTPKKKRRTKKRCVLPFSSSVSLPPAAPAKKRRQGQITATVSRSEKRSSARQTSSR
jgi:hypothetical protein